MRQLDAFKAIADSFGAQLRITRLRPSGRGADVWDELHPTADQQRELYDWLVAHGENVLTGDSFFHLAGYGQELPGLNMCGAGRVVCLIDPVGDVYACPFAIHDEFLAGNVRAPGGFAGGVAQLGPVRRACGDRSPAGRARRARRSMPARAGAWRPSSSPGCRWTGQTPNACAASARPPSRRPTARPRPAPAGDHSHRGRATAGGLAETQRRVPVPVSIGPRPEAGPVSQFRSVPDRACDQSPLAGFAPQAAG